MVCLKYVQKSVQKVKKKNIDKEKKLNSLYILKQKFETIFYKKFTCIKTIEMIMTIIFWKAEKNSKNLIVL